MDKEITSKMTQCKTGGQCNVVVFTLWDDQGVVE